jgi:hypothetical protein
LSYNSISYTYSLASGQGTTSGSLGIDTTPVFHGYQPYNDVFTPTYTSGSVFNDLNGTGSPVLLGVNTGTTTQTINSGGNTGSSQVTVAGLTDIVTYTYAAPTPEPSTFAMIGSGLAGLGLMIRRRSSK